MIDENKQSINQQVNQSCLQKRLKDQGSALCTNKYRQNNIPTKKCRQNGTLQKSHMCVDQHSKIATCHNWRKQNIGECLAAQYNVTKTT